MRKSQTAHSPHAGMLFWLPITAHRIAACRPITNPSRLVHKGAWAPVGVLLLRDLVLQRNLLCKRHVVLVLDLRRQRLHGLCNSERCLLSQACTGCCFGLSMHQHLAYGSALVRNAGSQSQMSQG